MKARRYQNRIWGGIFASAALVFLCFPNGSRADTKRIDSPSERYPRTNLLEPRRVIDAPTASSLPRGVFEVDGRVYPSGGAQLALNVGVFSRFMFGIAYGAQNLVSDEPPEWNPRVEFFAKYKIFDENWYMPAVALGYERQGFGPYIDSLDRYLIKSKGFFAVATKTYSLSGLAAGFHGGVNYNPFEGEKDGDQSPSFFIGQDTRISNYVALLAEYDFAFDDDKNQKQFGRGWGYLNLGVRWLFSENLWLEADFRDMFQNRTGVGSFGRELRLIYVESF
ncbi:MAG: hypothetical protein L0196_06580 [candidate division Zixibacteria bacterium]|nr:hypothetical protein [candidate division Zixibacteria bacterium]